MTSLTVWETDFKFHGLIYMCVILQLYKQSYPHNIH